MKRLEDLYLPYRPKKQTLATKAAGARSQPAGRRRSWPGQSGADLDARAADFVNTDKGVPDAASAVSGRRTHSGRAVQRSADLRQRVRKIYRKSGKLVSTKVEDNPKKNQQFHDYLDFHEPLHRMPPHRVLAINRGERAKVLRVKVDADEPAIEHGPSSCWSAANHPHNDFLSGCVRDALDAAGAAQLGARGPPRADRTGRDACRRGLRPQPANLLLQPPLHGRRVLAVDPGFKNGCKLAALDEFGKLLDHDVIHRRRQAPSRKPPAAPSWSRLIRQHKLNVIAIGNGTACRRPKN